MGRHKLIYEDNSKLAVTELYFEGVVRIHLAQNGTDGERLETQ
jgi:hypothetical protein